MIWKNTGYLPSLKDNLCLETLENWVSKTSQGCRLPKVIIMSYLVLRSIINHFCECYYGHLWQIFLPTDWYWITYSPSILCSCLCVIWSPLFLLILRLLFEHFPFVNILLEVQTSKEMAIVFQWSQPVEARGTPLRISSTEDSSFWCNICIKLAIQ